MSYLARFFLIGLTLTVPLGTGLGGFGTILGLDGFTSFGGFLLIGILILLKISY